MHDPRRRHDPAFVAAALVALAAIIAGCRAAKEADAHEIVTRYVTASALNCREAADAGSPILSRLERGRGVEVSETNGAWAKVEADGSDCWVASEHLADEPPPIQASAVPAEEPRSGPFRHVDTCPCTGSHLCTGPKGGRFCVTSGGWKEYQ